MSIYFSTSFFSFNNIIFNLEINKFSFFLLILEYNGYISLYVISLLSISALISYKRDKELIRYSVFLYASFSISFLSNKNLKDFKFSLSSF